MIGRRSLIAVAVALTGSAIVGGLQRALGEDYLITEDGLSGRTTVFDDGRIPVSVPWMCRQWNMSAYGYEEEPGCDVDGEYSCGPDGILTYRDTSREE